MSSLSLFIAIGCSLIFSFGALSKAEETTVSSVRDVFDPQLKTFDSFVVINNPDNTFSFRANWHAPTGEIRYRFLGKNKRYTPDDLRDLRSIAVSGVDHVVSGGFSSGIAGGVLAISACMYMGSGCLIAALGPLAAPSFEGYSSRGLSSQIKYLAVGAVSWIVIGVTVVGTGVAVSANIRHHGEVKGQLLDSSTVVVERSWFRRYSDYFLRGISPHATTQEILTRHILEMEQTLMRLERNWTSPPAEPTVSPGQNLVPVDPLVPNFVTPALSPPNKPSLDRE